MSIERSITGTQENNDANGVIIDRLDRRLHEYHLHLAAGYSPGLEDLREFAKKQGYKDDRLISQVRMNTSMAVRSLSCPLYALHVSLHPTNRNEFVEEQERVSEKLKNLPGIVAYFHGEIVRRLHEVIPASSEAPEVAEPTISWEKLEADWHEKTKTWDAHFGLPSKNFTPGMFNAFVEQGGLYMIERARKMEDGSTKNWTVLTIQGINPVEEGEKLYMEILESLRKAPVRSSKDPFSIWSTFEATTRMERYGDNRIAPPTMIDWRKRQ